MNKAEETLEENEECARLSDVDYRVAAMTEHAIAFAEWIIKSENDFQINGMTAMDYLDNEYTPEELYELFNNESK